MRAAVLGLVVLGMVSACRPKDTPPGGGGGSACPGAPGCGCRSEGGMTTCVLGPVVDMPSTTKPGLTSVVGTYTSADRPTAVGIVTLDVSPEQVAAARAHFQANKSMACGWQYVSAPCPPTDALYPQLPPFSP